MPPPSLVELYRSEPSEFLATRQRLVKDLRAAGDTEAARMLATRRKPTLAAHALNRVAHEHPEDIDAYLEAGRLVRQAQIDAARDDRARARVRELDRDRRTRADTILGRVAGHRDDAERALGAALSDSALADALRTGTLERIPDTTAGFDAFAADLGDGAPPRVASTRRRDQQRQARERRALDEDITTAEAELAGSEAARRTAAEALRAAERRVEAATRARDALRARRDQLDGGSES